MSRVESSLKYALIVLAVGLLCLWTVPAQAQTAEPPGTVVTAPEPPEVEAPEAEPPDTEATEPPESQDADEDNAGTPSTAHPPAYVGEMMKTSGLQQAQVDQMRASGMGWGEVRIATRLGEQIAANSGGTLTFDAALAQVLADRAAGKGWGDIAAANNLKVGKLVKQDGKKGKSGHGSVTTTAAKDKKSGVPARGNKAMRSGHSAGKPAKADKPQLSGKAAKGGRPDHSAKLERAAKPQKMERPTKVEKPSKPQRPERGPNR